MASIWTLFEKRIFIEALVKPGNEIQRLLSEALSWRGKIFISAGENLTKSLKLLARPKRFELLTPRFVVCSYSFATVFRCTTHYHDKFINRQFYCFFRTIA